VTKTTRGPRQLPDTGKGRDRLKLDVPFAMVPEWIIDHPGISDRALRLYCVLCRHANADKGDTAWPARSTLARRLNCTVDTVDRAIRQLVEASAISVEKRISSHGDPDSNLYTVHVVPPEGVAAQMRPPGRTVAATGSRSAAARGSRTDAALTKASRNESQLNESSQPAAPIDVSEASATPPVAVPEKGLHDAIDKIMRYREQALNQTIRSRGGFHRHLIENESPASILRMEAEALAGLEDLKARKDRLDPNNCRHPRWHDFGDLRICITCHTELEEAS
jgi:Helix-turn-helix domain